MRRQTYRPYIFLFIFLLSLLSIPPTATKKIRLCVISIASPISFFRYSHEDRSELERLTAENISLKNHIESVKEWLLSEERIDEQLEKYKSLGQPPAEDFFKKRSAELCKSLELQLKALPARVIFRQPDAWSSVLWLNVGENENQALNCKIVAVNSPVIFGSSIVGVVEEVAYKSCKVRLVTDPNLVPSVRAVRGSKQNHYLKEHIEELIQALALREDLPLTSSHMHCLNQLKDIINMQATDCYLAKGELHGCASTQWRSCSQILKGTGFNFDYADEEGNAKDLRSDILKPGDLLVTTGYDGVFPPGFHVATVSKVMPLREGACSYDLEALLTCGNLNELDHFLVLPPMY